MPLLLGQGGWILIAILLSSFTGWLILVYKWIAIRSEKRTISGWTEVVLEKMKDQEVPDAVRVCCEHPSILGRVLNTAIGSQGLRRGMFEKQMTRFVDAEMSKLKRGLGLVSRLAALSPLLGLLGTVVGLVETFDVITVYGSNDSMLLADGIGQALLTTQVGLIVALPLIVLHHWLHSSANRVEDAARLHVKKTEIILCKV